MPWKPSPTVFRIVSMCPICDHGRTSRNKYLVEKQMPFELKEDLVIKEIEFMNSLAPHKKEN